MLIAFSPFNTNAHEQQNFCPHLSIVYAYKRAW